MKDLAALTARVRTLTQTHPGRVIIGLVGPPGSGKSTLAEHLVRHLGEDAALLPMDGYHLAQVELRRQGKAARKGAPDTFDSGGYAALLQRLLADQEVVYAPMFDRSLEEPIAGAIEITPQARIVITEGIYLLYDRDGWSAVGPMLTESWYLDVADNVRVPRLRARHEHYGRSAAEAASWVAQVDEPNAVMIKATRHRATLIIPDDVDLDGSRN